MPRERWENAVLQIAPTDIIGQNVEAYFNQQRRPELDDLPIDEALNVLGEDGWELATVFTGSATSGLVYYLKRPKE